MNEQVKETGEVDVGSIRRQLNEIKAAEGLSWPDIERTSGVKRGTLSTFATDKYAGDNERVAREVGRWINSRRASATVTATLPDVPSFRPTPSANEVLALLRYAHVAQDLCIAVGVPGVGKTSAIDQYVATTPNVWKLTVSPSVKSVYGLLVKMCEVMRVSEKNAALLSQRLESYLQDKEGLLVVDEAQHATMEILEELRSFSDSAGVGLVLSGNHEILRKLSGSSGRGRYAQLVSRIGGRVVINKLRKADIEAIADAWNVTDPQERGFLHRIGGRPGALRNITKTMRLAGLLAQGAEEPRAIGHIQQAWRQLAGLDETS
ncbi:AAA family ATPase [Marivibrio halodurans]|uniref:AAA family ATPase n=1 Tax=Marivibrio halodurans TaxID=2039722 RepID=A0A8J7S5Q8_9PROT|nr:AAA family ATPase [Marivibrio halodurans]MBP5857259.1 AAA family ATPase [Marivibrio halodurans]